MLTEILGSQLEWIICWRVGRKPIRTNIGRLVMTNIYIYFPVVLSVDEMMGKEELVILATLS